MRIPEDTIAEIMRRVDIVDLIKDYVSLKQAGKNYKGLCPFHTEKTPSFSVSPDGVFYCFGCRESGNSISFLQKYLNISYVEAIKLLADKYGVRLEETKYDENTTESRTIRMYEIAQNFYAQALFRHAGAYDYFNERNLKDETMTTFGLGYSPVGFDNIYKELRRAGFTDDIMIESGLVRLRNGKIYDFFNNRAMFPIKDFLGRVIAFGGRQLSNDKSLPKYINSPDSIIYDKKQTLFGLYEAKNEIRKTNSAIIVEGYIDVISLYQAGFKNVVAPCGTALSKEQLQTLKKHAKADILYFMFDGDVAGSNATVRGIEFALELNFDLRIIMLPPDKDPDTIVNDYGGIEQMQKYINEEYISFVDFIVKKLSLEGKLNTPAEKAAAIKYVTSYIITIPDKTQHKFYIENLKEIFDVEMSILRNIYQTVQKELNYAKAKKTNFNNNKLLDLDAISNEKKYNINLTTETQQESFNINELLPEEQKIIQFAVHSNEYFNILIEKYNVTVDIFISELAKIIFEILTEYTGSSQSLIQEIINAEELSDDIKSIVSQLKLERIEESQNWKKFTNENLDEIENPIELIKVPLAELRIKQIDVEYQELQKKIFLDDTKILVRMRELLDEKKLINETDLRYE